MTEGEDPAVPDSKRRKFDRNLMETGHRLAHRVVEPVPFCWFCDRTAGTRSKEHIFPQWLLRHHDAMDERVHPTRISLPLGGAVVSERGERPLRAHVNGEVCADCNNGWMSALEAAAMPILTQEPRQGAIPSDDVGVITRWFAKTAVNLNVTQPFRLLVEAQSRHGLATGIPSGFAVHLFRSAKQNGVFDWVQKSPEMALCPQDQQGDILKIMELTLVTHIRIADLVGVVVYAPKPLRPEDVVLPDATRIYPPSGRRTTWETVPLLTDYLDGIAIVEMKDAGSAGACPPDEAST
ncbi:hypothetical protein [Citricoccus sp. NR2]|uniref:hypothetical protein n=1 Tax=Citricoccus sp. NR2 TaxID=3004095 RepID=UPI0022DD4FF1|nr:hypothetical protein [Citricoccus sp. NR2]WBL18779.1 hypothetical protein O1A05_13635 [Citricoccus sp. NR2]